MGQVRGSTVRIIGVTDTAYRTPPVAPDAVILPFVSHGVAASETRDTDETIDGYRGENRSVAGAQTLNGPVQINAAPQTIGFWLKHLIGAPTSTTATGVTTHVFAPAASGATALPPSFTLEQDMGAGFTPASRYVRHLGCRVASCAISMGPTGFVQFTPTITGSNATLGSTALDSTPTDTGHRAFEAIAAALVFGGGSLDLDVAKMDIAITNNLDEDTVVIGSNGLRGDLPEGKFGVSGSIDTLVKGDAMLQQALTDTDTSLVLTLKAGSGDGTEGNEQLVVTIPAIAFAKNTPVVPGPKGLRLTSNFTSHRTNGETGVTFTLKTPLATIA